MRSLKTAGVLLALVLLMASCIRVDGNIKVEDDGSGSVDFLTALNTDVLTTVLTDFDFPESELGGTDELCSGFESDFGDVSDLPNGATVTPYDEDGFCGSRVQYSLAASLDHSAAITQLFDDTARLYKEGDNWFFDTALDVDDITSEADGAPAAMLDALFGDATFRIAVDLPGRAIDGENNATEVGADGKFVWNIDLLNPPARLFAQTEPGSGGGSGGGGISPILIGLLIAALLGGAALFLFMKQRNDGTTTAAAAASPGAFDPSMGAATSSTMPVTDGPPIQAAGYAGSGSVPDPHAVKETVMINPAQAQQMASAATAEASAAVPAAPQPVWDESLGAWIVDDPARGRLRHDPATDTWNPV